jgi:hypothetical protein
MRLARELLNGAPVFECDTSNNPLLARSDKFVRVGGLVSPLGLCLIAVTARLLDPSRQDFIREVLCLTAAGQALTWWGMDGIRRSQGWCSGVVSYVWAGGVMTGLAVSSTAIIALAPIPLLAPLVATFARWRMHRRARSAGVPR